MERISEGGISYPNTRCRLAWLMLAATVAFSGSCSTAGSIDDAHHIRKGIDPEHQEEDVRFQTTYYFRSFEVCERPDGFSGGSRGVPISDSLYRFRMTGKANSLANVVHFESGILHKDQIDPFGADADYDDKTHRFRYRSQAETERSVRLGEIRTARVAREEEAIRLTKRRDDFLKAHTEDASKYEKEITELNGLIANLAKSSDALLAEEGELLKPVTASTTPPRGNETGSNLCGPGYSLRRGFQILGPEGWRTFDQDQRLVLAMSTDGKPLISTMKELSNRVLQGQTPSQAQQQLALAKERQNILNAEHQAELMGRSLPAEPKRITCEIARALNGGTEPPIDEKTKQNPCTVTN